MKIKINHVKHKFYSFFIEMPPILVPRSLRAMDTSEAKDDTRIAEEHQLPDNKTAPEDESSKLSLLCYIH